MSRASILFIVLTAIAVSPSLRGQSTANVELISATPAGLPGGSAPQRGVQKFSADKRYVVFASASSQLVAGDTNGFTDIFVRDRQTGTTTLVSRASDGSLANGNSGKPAISANGRFVAFTSEATNLVPGDTNGFPDVFVRDLVTGTTSIVSI